MPDRAAPPPRKSINTVRGRLVLLTISLLIPALLSTGLLLAGAERQSREQRNDQLLTTARALSGVTDRQAAVGVAITETLASDQALQAGDWKAFDALARRATAKRDGWVVLTETRGQQIVNTRVPYGAPLPVSPRAAELARAYKAGVSRVGNVRFGGVARKPVIAVGTPVAIQGKPYVLTYVVAASSFTSVFRQQRVPKDWVATLLDRDGMVIARSDDQERWVGRPAPADLVTALKQASQGVTSGRAADGQPTLVAYIRSPQTGWTLSMAIPRTGHAGGVDPSVVAAIGVFLSLLVLGLGLALFFSRGISREVGRLAVAAHAIGHGGPIVMPTRRGLEEIDAIRAALSAAALELQGREEHHTLMINELNHRVKNTLATVQALARQTFGKADARSVEVFTERLIALSGAHDLLTRGGWRQADLGELMAVCMGAHGGRIHRAGPVVPLDPHTAVALSMVFHELATNSAKYGALSMPAGDVSLVWRIDLETRILALTWTETGGPPVRAPGKPGFGTRLIDGSIRRELRGEARFDFRSAGLVFEAVLPLPLMDGGRWVNPGLGLVHPVSPR